MILASSLTCSKNHKEAAHCHWRKKQFQLRAAKEVHCATQTVTVTHLVRHSDFILNIAYICQKKKRQSHSGFLELPEYPRIWIVSIYHKFHPLFRWKFLINVARGLRAKSTHCATLRERLLPPSHRTVSALWASHFFSLSPLEGKKQIWSYNPSFGSISHFPLRSSHLNVHPKTAQHSVKWGKTATARDKHNPKHYFK